MDSKLLRAYVCLEDGNFEEAKKYAKDILHADSYNAEAYLVLLMANIGVRKRTQLGKLQERFDGYTEYREIMKSDDQALKDELLNYLNEIDIRVAETIHKQELEEKERQEKEREKQNEKEKAEAINRCGYLETAINRVRYHFDGSRVYEIETELKSIKSSTNDAEVIQRVDELLLQIMDLRKRYNRHEKLVTLSSVSIAILGLGGFIVGRFVLGSFLTGCFLGMAGVGIGSWIFAKVSDL